MQSKIDLRRAIKERLSHLTAKDRNIESRVICRELKTVIETRPCTISAYCPYLDEPNIAPLLEELMKSGWIVSIPGFKGNNMVMRRISSLAEVKKNPRTGILESPDGLPEVNPAAISIVIIPGRAFTKSGDRMGRGNGGYDRWIPSQKQINPSTRLIGTCFECQLMTELPVEEHDQKMDLVITGRGIVSAHD